MRYECARSDAATKWFVIDLLSIGMELFAVTSTYGVKGPSGEDQILQKLKSIYNGPYLDALEHLTKKISERESVGYTKIETKTQQ